MIKLDIISDPICPWCLIGKTRLFQALERAHDAAIFEIEWHPFQLNPDMPPDGMDRRTYLEAKFGGKKQAIAVYSQIDAAAKDAGLHLKLSEIKRTPNTLNAHRLIHWAGLEGVQTPVVERLFKAYFIEGRDISHEAVLLDIAEHSGMDKIAVKRLLASEADREDIIKRDYHSRSRGVSGVPCFIIGEEYAVQGAQTAETWLSIIKDLKAKLT